MRRVVVTGLGAVTPLGVGVQTTWSRLLKGVSGIVSTSNLEPRERWEHLKTSHVAGLVPTQGQSFQHGAENGLAFPSNALWDPKTLLSSREHSELSTFAQYATVAAKMALDSAKWNPDPEPDNGNGTGNSTDNGRDETGVCIGSGIGNLDELYNTSSSYAGGSHRTAVSPRFVPKIMINQASGYIAMRHGFRGPNHAATTACATGSHSIGDASRFIAFGDADVMVAGGTEACIHPLTFAGFARSRSLSKNYLDEPHLSCRPFDRERSGFVVSEGAAVLILEELEHARARGATILAELKGYGCSGDAHHMTAPSPGGEGALLAMKKALRNAGVKPADVDYINAHATGTPVGDLAEATAIRSLMMGEDGVNDESKVTVSSTKGATGHLLGAAGALEAMFCVMAIAEVSKISQTPYVEFSHSNLQNRTKSLPR